AQAVAVYDQAFRDISNLRNPAIHGVVVSADPWFTVTGAALVAAANNWTAAGAKRFICYPLKEFKKNNKPKNGSRVLHGRKLKQAYKDLGTSAKKYLANATPIPIIVEPEDVTED